MLCFGYILYISLAMSSLYGLFELAHGSGRWIPKACPNPFAERCVISPFDYLVDVIYGSESHVVVSFGALPPSFGSLYLDTFVEFVWKHCNKPIWLMRDFPIRLSFDEFILRSILLLLRHDMQHIFSTRTNEFPNQLIFHCCRLVTQAYDLQDAVFCSSCAEMLKENYNCQIVEEHWIENIDVLPFVLRVRRSFCGVINVALHLANYITMNKQAFFCNMCSHSLFYLISGFSIPNLTTPPRQLSSYRNVTCGYMCSSHWAFKEYMVYIGVYWWMNVIEDCNISRANEEQSDVTSKNSLMRNIGKRIVYGDGICRTRYRKNLRMAHDMRRWASLCYLDEEQNPYDDDDDDEEEQEHDLHTKTLLQKEPSFDTKS